MKTSDKKKDARKNQQLVQTPEHDKPGRIMSPPPFELDASWNTRDAPPKKREEEEEVEKENGEQEKA